MTSTPSPLAPRPPRAGDEARRMTIPETIDAHLEEDLVELAPPEHIEFELGDNVVYPHHGAGKVLKKERRKMFGEEREYLTIKILHNDMTVMVPCENAALAGLRRLQEINLVDRYLQT
jgi:CarD family transcriptional regulator